MRKSTAFIGLILLTELLVGCNASVEDFVKSAKPELKTQPSISSNGPTALKVSPGKMNASAADMALQGTVTATNQKFAAGSDMSVRLTINRSRAAVQ